MADVEIGIGRSARLAYALGDVSVVPSRRTRDPQEVSVAWEIDAYRFGLPVMASAMDSVVSPATAVEIGRLGGLAVLDLEGVWTRYEDPGPALDRIVAAPAEQTTAVLREVYATPVRPELVRDRVAELKAAGLLTAAAVTPNHTLAVYEDALAAGLDLLVIRGSVVSAEHRSTASEPLNLKLFIADLDIPVIVGGCSSFTTALHLMRTGAAGVLVGIGNGRACTTRTVTGLGAPLATAIADAAAARVRYLDESGGRYVHVLADGGLRSGGDVARAVACGADAVVLGSLLARAEQAPGRGWHWGIDATHRTLPRGERVAVGTVGSLEQVLVGPATTADGTTNVIGGLRRSMAATGYGTLKELQRAELAVRAI